MHPAPREVQAELPHEGDAAGRVDARGVEDPEWKLLATGDAAEPPLPADSRRQKLRVPAILSWPHWTASPEVIFSPPNFPT